MTTSAADPAPIRSLALIGYRATGKSTVGRLLASRLGSEFVDADRALEERHELSIPEIFRVHGEPRFRDWESQVLADLTAQARVRPIVLATGGGVVLRPENRAYLRQLGPSIWLWASTEEIVGRLTRDPQGVGRRPALSAAGTLEEVATLLKIREPLYRELADLTVETDGRSAEEVADLITSHLGCPVTSQRPDSTEWKGDWPRC